MFTSRVRTLAVLSFLIGASCNVQAQDTYTASALGVAQPGTGVGARALGLGGAFLAVADDYSALYWNPAGLAQLRYNELSIGLSGLFNGTDANFLSTSAHSTTTNQVVDQIGLVYPVPMRSGSALAFGIGFNRIADFTRLWTFGAVNPTSSIVSYDTRTTTDFANSIPYMAYLAGYVNGVPTTPITGGLRQSGDVDVRGGLNAFSIGGGGELAEGLFLGATINIYTGEYNYSRIYRESDVNNVYNQIDTVNWTTSDLYEYAQTDTVETSITGIGGTIGLLYDFNHQGAFGLTFTFPSSFHMSRNAHTAAQASFDNGDRTSLLTYVSHDDYDVTTPMTFGGGLSWRPVQGLIVAGSGQFIDYSQVELSSGGYYNGYSAPLRENFRSTYAYQIGAEYKVPVINIGVRAGYFFAQAPYTALAANDGTKGFSVGASVVLAQRGVLELAYVNTTSQAVSMNYDATSEVFTKTTAGQVHLNFGYRFK